MKFNSIRICWTLWWSLSEQDFNEWADIDCDLQVSTAPTDEGTILNNSPFTECACNNIVICYQCTLEIYTHYLSAEAF